MRKQRTRAKRIGYYARMRAAKWTPQKEHVFRAAMRWYRAKEKCLLISQVIYWGALVSANTMLDKACSALSRAPGEVAPRKRGRKG